MGNKNFTLILGMHRSGTSALTRGLEALGVSLGQKLLPGAEGINDKGFFEDTDFLSINIAAMKRLGLTWDSLASVDFSRMTDPDEKALSAIARKFLKDRLGKYQEFGIKDPRACRTLPFWQSVFKTMDCSPRAIISIRNPVSVADSLANRDGFARAKSHYLWIRHVFESVDQSRWMSQRVVVDYDHLMSDPSAQLRRISGGLGLKLDAGEAERFQQEFLDSSLRHSVAAENWKSASVPSLVSSLYELLLRVAKDELSLDSEQFESEFGVIREGIQHAFPLLDYSAELEQELHRAQLQIRNLPGDSRSSSEQADASFEVKNGEQASLSGGRSATISLSGSNRVDTFESKPLPTMEDWLADREPSIAEKRFLSEKSSDLKWPSIQIVVIDFEQEIGPQSPILKSLETALEHLPGVHVTVISEVEFDGLGLPGEFVSLSVERGGQVRALNDLCSSGAFDWLLPVTADVEFTPFGLLRLAFELQGVQGLEAVYADEIVRMSDGALGTAFKPDFNLDLLLSYPAAMARFWLYSRSAIEAAVGFDVDQPSAFEFAMILRLIERSGFGGIAHAAEPILTAPFPAAKREEEPGILLSHLHNRGYEKARVSEGVPGTWRIDYGHERKPSVSIIIPTRDQIELLQRCVETLLEQTAYKNFEVLIVDNDSREPAAVTWLAGLEKMGLEQVRVLRYPHAFNYSAMNNMAAREAAGEYLVLLNNDTAILYADWLEAMLNHALRPEVGIVGAKLLYPEGQVQHAGVVLGLNGPAEHPFNGAEFHAPGYMNRLQVDQNYSAVTAACLMIPKAVYESVGGLDEEAFKVSYNDVDLCLKVREAGYLCVWTPHSVVMQAGSVRQKEVDKTTPQADRKRFLAEQDKIYEKWLPILSNDPAYNRNLSLNGDGYAVEGRANLMPSPIEVGAGLPRLLLRNADVWGCGNYRMIKPFEALRAEGMAGGAITRETLSLCEVARMDPDVLVVQRQTSAQQIEEMRRVKQFANKFLVYELDDYLPNLPLKSAYRSNMPKDVLKSIRSAMKWVDRFVVSTNPLAEAFSKVHPNIHVVENCLPLDWWGNLKSMRQQGEKPRVGWAGGVGHTGDLELVTDVVRDLADEVDWVFFGMCPESLLPFVHESHKGVEISQYPEKLASLNLDLAIAPLEDNLFNRCKSNLRLLEYGICGFPVVCSDVEPYREHNLPVTRVRNRYKDWVDAIRMHINDREQTALQGDRLQAVIRKDWMLEGANLQLWLNAWNCK